MDRTYEDAKIICSKKTRIDSEVSQMTKEIIRNIGLRERMNNKEVLDFVFKEFYETQYDDYMSLYRHICFVYPNKSVLNNKIEELDIPEELQFERKY